MSAAVETPRPNVGREVRQPFLTAQWRDLVVLNYEADPAILAPLLPEGLALTSIDGRYYLSLLAFRFLDTRLKGLAIPGHVHFPEVNLRTYAHPACFGAEPPEAEKGVVFLQELVPKAMVAWTARVLYGEPYRRVAMSATIADPEYRYDWSAAGLDYQVQARRVEEWRAHARTAEPSPFLDHFRGYSRQRGRRTVAYSIARPGWRWAPAAVSASGDFAQLYGDTLGGFLRTPQSCYLAEGSEIAIGHPEALPR